MFNRFKRSIARFFYGRYGADDLYNAGFLCVLVLLFAGTVFNILSKAEPDLALVAVIVYLVAIALMLLTVLRSFSRNIPRRRLENEAWLRFLSRLRPKHSKRPPDTADHIFRTCPHCRATLRLPRSPGKHEVKCPRCGHRFGVKVRR